MRVLIAHPGALLEEGLARVVSNVAPHAVVVRARKQDLLARAVEAGAPDALIVAYPWISLATLRALASRLPAMALVAVTGTLDAVTQRHLLAAHVAAIIPSHAPSDAIAAALRAVLCGEVTVHARSLRNEPDTAAASSRLRIAKLNLTPRQFDVLGLVARGHSNQTIADELGIGVRTVKGHVAVILRALHSDNRRDAGRRARHWLERRSAHSSTGPHGAKYGSVSDPLGTGPHTSGL